MLAIPRLDNDAVCYGGASGNRLHRTYKTARKRKLRIRAAFGSDGVRDCGQVFGFCKIFSH